MTSTTPEHIREILGWVFALNGNAFQQITTLQAGLTLALIVVLLAQLSLAIGQSIILFINQVKPVRFIFSLLISAVLYLFEFLFLVFSTWLLCQFPGTVSVSLPILVTVLGLSYAPLLFGFLGALPYLGFPVLRVLSIWHLLAMVVGFGAVANIGLAGAFGYVAIGWFVKELLGNTIGQPISKFGRQIAEQVAGVDLVLNRTEIEKIVQSGLDTRIASTPSPTPQPGAAPTGVAEAQRREPMAPASAAQAVELPLSNPETDIGAPVAHWLRGIPQLIRMGLIFLGMILLFVVIAILLRPIRLSLFGWYTDLPWLVRRTFDLVWIGVISLVFAGFLAPLEALGWWSGWYGDEVNTEDAIAISPAAAPSGDRPSRYVVYLDGVSQSSDAYTPDVVDFIEALQPALPKDMELVQGLMLYSVLNKPLNQDRPLAAVWRLADKMRWQNPAALLGMMVNVRNALIVAVSADKRYGPIYNQGIAQVLYNGLIKQGYQPGDGVPLTLIGYSGGGQMAIASAPYLKRVLGCEIDVISLGGVMSANCDLLKLNHLYHLTGEKDSVTKLGPILFPGRWKLFPLSYWNRALRKGKISLIPLGPMGHQVPGGIMDPVALLPSGESFLQHTITLILSILNGQFLVATPPQPKPISNYAQYKQAAFNDYSYYPLNQTVDLQWYQPIAPWMGRLILPQSSERKQVRGVWFEVHHAPIGYESWVGQRVMLRWAEHPTVKQMVRAVTQDVHFSVDAEYSSRFSGGIYPDRLNHWQQVGPLESLAGSHPVDDLIVMLKGEVTVEETGSQEPNDNGGSASRDQRALYIYYQPAEITGRYYGVVRFDGPIANTDRFQVTHFNSASRQFDGWVEVVRLPPVVMAQCYGSDPSTTHQLERSPLNETGWYAYGAKDADGCFVVQSLAPRSLLRLQPDRVVFGSKASYRYIRKESWANAVAQKGKISSVLCVGSRKTDEIQSVIDEWKVGDRALLLHVYGGIGGNKKEPAAATPIFFGHFSFGIATVIHDPLSDERRFEIQYYQVYAHNTDGLIAGTLHWSRYMGDRQFGWLGTRPTCDILIKFEPFTGYFEGKGMRQSALSTMVSHLEAMTARYRIGDGTGATFVNAANNCAQDSNQALFGSIRSLVNAIADNQPQLQTWLANNPEEAQRYQQFLDVKDQLYRRLQPFGMPRADWDTNEFNLGTSLEDDPLRSMLVGLSSWRTLLPRKSSDMVVQTFLQHGADVWVLRTNQVGGYDPDIEPISPMTL